MINLSQGKRVVSEHGELLPNKEKVGGICTIPAHGSVLIKNKLVFAVVVTRPYE